MYPKLRFIILFVLFLSGLLSSNAQGLKPSRIDGKSVSFTELIEEMQRCTELTQFNDLTISFNYEKDKAGMDNWWVNGNHPIVIKQGIFLNNCTFDEEYWLVLRDITFLETFSFVQCRNLKIIFKNCDFHKSLRLNANETEFIDLENCRLQLGFKFERGNITDHLRFRNTEFTLNTKRFNEGGGFDMQDRLFFISNKVNPIDLTFENTTFKIPDTLKTNPNFFIDLSKSKFSGLHFKNSFFGTALDLTQSTVENQFSCTGTTFETGLLTSGLSINQMNATIEWNNIKDFKLAIFDREKGDFFNGKSALGPSREAEYTDLISCYSNFYYTFKGQGNRVASNYCYREWKNIEKEQQYATFKEKDDQNSYFLYLMDLFLEYFCDYGTNPIKAIFKSINVIVVFALVYFLSPTIIEDKPRRNFYSQLMLYSDYLKSGQKFRDVFNNHLELFREITILDKYRQKVISNKSDNPFYFRYFGTTLDKHYKNALVRVEEWMHKRLELGEKRWPDLPKNQRMIYGSVFFVILVLCAVYFIFLRVFDSIILSLNMFCTLGFGELRVRGFAMYITIIEGFVGWFLLSIFSVALLNQVLQ